MFKASVSSVVRPVAAALFAAILLRAPATAQVALTGGTYTQDFNTTVAAVPPGWLFSEAGTNANTSFSTGTGTSNAGDTYFLGTPGEWTFGGLQSGSLIPTVGVAFVNNTGSTITSLSVAYTGETWRVGAANRSDRLDFQYSLDATSLTTGTWTDVDALDYANPGQPATGSGSLQNSAAISATFGGFSLANGATIYFRWVDFNASGADDAMGVDDFSLTTGGIVSPTPPSVVTPPASQTVTEGDTVHFTVVANGTAPLSYQWRKGGTPLADGGIITGSTTDTLTLTGVGAGDAGSYDVVVTNTVDSATSAAATLVVNPALQAPVITSQPGSQSVALGGVAHFSVTATSTTPLAFQWRKGGAPLTDGGSISGATTATLSVGPVTAGDFGDYDVVVSNGTPPDATSNQASLTLGALVTPTGQIAYEGGSYLQSFDTLPAAGTFTLTGIGPLSLDAAPIDASGLGGWTLAKYAGTGTVALFRVDAGTSTTGSVYSYGSAGSSDRALGSLSSGSTISRFGATLVNSTGRTITEFTLGYTGEQWRRGTGAANTLTFDYSTGATDLNNGAFTTVPALAFTAPVTSGSAGALDGNANGVSIAATVTGLSWAPGATLVLRWSDVDDTGSDDGLAIDDLSLSTPVAANDILPSIVYTTPADETVNVPASSAVSLTFNEAVNFTTSSFTLTGSTSGAHVATLSGGPGSYTLTPNVPFDEGETVTLSIPAAQVTDAATGTQHPAADVTVSFITFSSAPLAIHTVQGHGLTSPYAGLPVTTQGVVVASFQGANQIGGYYLETPDASQDADPATSEGIYVFDNTNSVTAGDLVTVTGTVTEYGTAPTTETEISGVTAFTKVGTGNSLPTAVAVTLPFADAAYAERYEGMRVTFPQSLTVTDNYDLGIFGELLLSNGRLPTPTNIVAPGAPAQAQEAANLLNQIILDDGLSVNDPDPTPYLNSTDPAIATRRSGSLATGVMGILDNKFGTYVVEPTAVPTFVEANPRANSPASTGSLRIVIGNIENFMNGDGAGGGFPTSRGATTEAEYERQLAKVTAAILNLSPDIMGLTEVENDRVTNGSPDSYGPTSAIAELVASLNAGAPAGTTYAFVNAAAVDITTDEIHVAFIYRTQAVEMVGAPQMLDDPAFDDVARNPLAQTFREIATGEKLTVCINHLRAKGSAAAGAGNADSGDGQGTNNALRVQEATALTSWLATDPTGSGDPDFLIIGDMNSYAKEDPIVAIENAGYTSLTERFEGEGGYSYSFNGEFGHLDHALASPHLNAQVLSAATWHVNSDEPPFYDYNLEYKSAAQQAVNAGTPYRYSDHDPVVIGVTLTSPPVLTATLSSQTAVVGNSVTFQVTATGTPPPTYQWRLNGSPISGATSSTYTIASVLTADAGSYDVVVTNSVGSVTSDPATLTVNPAAGALSLSGLIVPYDGNPHPVAVTTAPTGLDATVTYNGGTTAPVYPGSYTVIATLNGPDYTGTVTGTETITVTALVRHAPTMNGGLDGSVQVLLPESTTLNGSAWISGDLLVPGTPLIKLNGHPVYAGTLDGTGAASPSSYTITLNGSAALRHVVRRIDPIDLPVVAAPPAPTGTRNVALNSAGQSPGDFATLRNLTLNGNAGQLVVPPGTYGAFTVNGSSSLVFGTAGSATPVVYNLQNLTLNGNSQLIIAGPVIINLANGTALNGSVGSTSHPEWLNLAIASGGLTLNGNVTFAGYITAPAGTVIVNGNTTLTGGVACDRLTLNGNGVLVEPQP